MENSPHILLVDDEVNILSVLTDMLREMGFTVAPAAGPEDALRLIAGERFHIALIDNYLGSTDGIRLIEQITAIDPDVHCIIMTGNPNIDLAIHALKQGVCDFLRKPFRSEDLLISIDHVNRKRELERQRREVMSMLESAVREKTDELNQVYLSVLAALSRTVEKRDLGTYGHSMRVSTLSVLVAEALGLAAGETDVLRDASLLHDIGKIGISDSILAKPSRLTEDEFALIKSHPEKGVEILQPLKQFQALLPAILHHHERYDGSGYPAHLRGDAIPLMARIISVSDTYDAIVSNRPYRNAKCSESALAQLRDWSGRQFDPAIVDAFIGVVTAEEGALRELWTT